MARIEPISREDMNEAQARVHDAAKAAGNPGCWTLHGLYPDSRALRKCTGYAHRTGARTAERARAADRVPDGLAALERRVIPGMRRPATA